MDRPCHLLPIGIDVESFVPAELGLERPIDVAYVGRRLPEVHEQALRWARERGAYYLFDTGRPPLYVEDPARHRWLYASQIKRTALAFAYPAKSDVDEETGGVQEIGARYFEFAAAGATILGTAPATERFDAEFSWPDALVPLPQDSASVGAELDALLEDAPRRRAIERAGICGTLRRHDWSHRFRDILHHAGLSPVPAVEDRIERLARRAERTERGHGRVAPRAEGARA